MCPPWRSERSKGREQGEERASRQRMTLLVGRELRLGGRRREGIDGGRGQAGGGARAGESNEQTSPNACAREQGQHSLLPPFVKNPELQLAAFFLTV